MQKKSINPMVYAALYLSKKSASEKVTFGNFIVTKMTANGNFTGTISPTLVAMQAAIDDLDAAVSAAESNSNEAKDDLLAKEGVFDMMLTSLKEFAENAANLAAAGDN